MLGCSRWRMSSRFARSATTRRRPGRSIRSSRRRTTSSRMTSAPGRFSACAGGPAGEPPGGEPDLEVEGARLWRVDEAPDLSSTQLLIADGHHRYETALAYAEEGGSPYLMVVLVPTRQEGLTIFPTHRVAQHVNGARGTPIEEPGDELPGVVLYRDGHYKLLESDALDVQDVA